MAASPSPSAASCSAATDAPQSATNPSSAPAKPGSSAAYPSPWTRLSAARAVASGSAACWTLAPSAESAAVSTSKRGTTQLPRCRPTCSAAEAGGDALLGGLVIGAGLLGELADALKGVLDPARGALPFCPQLLEAGLRDALPLALQRRDLRGELAEGGLDVRGPGVELGPDRLQLFRGDGNVGHALSSCAKTDWPWGTRWLADD